MPGTYVLQNAQSGAALDLCGAAQRTVVGFAPHGGANQQWEFVPSGAGYTIRSAASAERFLVPADGLGAGAAVGAGPFPASWRVQADEREGAVRIAWADTDLVLALADGGGDKVRVSACSCVGGEADGAAQAQLVHTTPGAGGELWRFVRCAEPAGERTARAHVPPITTETVIVAEERDCVTTTRTTTTTAITTITTVTRIPRVRDAAST
ncbi:hypothetical protein B0H21DRAFT_867442 [Amylocystis lapponica]|nr:hypothetical protein B0H21DRAFT_867442 [Amylocystis lapponica]